MIFNKIKELYFARLDEGGTAYTPEQQEVAQAVTAAIQSITSTDFAPIQAFTKSNPNAVTKGKRTLEMHGGQETPVITVYNTNFGRNPARVMFKGRIAWKGDRAGQFAIPGNPIWITLLNDYLGASADTKKKKESDKVGGDLTDAGVATTIPSIEDTDPVKRSGEYLGVTRPFKDQGLFDKVTKGLKRIAGAIVGRAREVRTETQANGGDTPQWAQSDITAGMRATGEAPGSWEWVLANARGVRWEKVEVKNEETGQMETVEKQVKITEVPESTLAHATESRAFFEEMASPGGFKIEDCEKVKDHVRINESYATPRISYYNDDKGIIKNAGRGEVDAFKRIKDSCNCKGEEGGEDYIDGCIKEADNIFGVLHRTEGGQDVNQQLGTMIESIRMSGLLLRLLAQIDTGDGVKDVEDKKRKKMLLGHVKRIITEAKHKDDKVQEEARARLEAFKQRGTDLESYYDIQTLEELERLAQDPDNDGQLYGLIARLEATDLSARNPDMVLPVGGKTGSGMRDDNIELHIDRPFLKAALINQGLDDTEAEEHIRSAKIGDLAALGVKTKEIEMFKEIYGLDDDSEVFYNGLSLKNQVDDGTTKFGELKFEAADDLFRLDPCTKEGQKGCLSEEDVAYRDKAYESLGITTDAEKRALRTYHKEHHNDIKETVWSVFPATTYYTVEKDGTRKQRNPKAAAKALQARINAEFPKADPRRIELDKLLKENDVTTEEGLGRVREKLARILTTNRAHENCNRRNRDGKLSAGAILARKHLATMMFFTGGVTKETLASKRGLISGDVSVYSQNAALLPALQGIINDTWDVKPSGTTTGIEERSTKRYLSFKRQGDGDGLKRDTRYSVMVGKKYLEKHLLSAVRNLFTGKTNETNESTFDMVASLIKTQQELFTKLLVEVR